MLYETAPKRSGAHSYTATPTLCRRSPSGIKISFTTTISMDFF